MNLSDYHFGPVRLDAADSAFNRRMNQRLRDLCRRLPRPLRTEALLFLFKQAGIAPDGDFDFFRIYYAPIWTIVPQLWEDRITRNETPNEGWLDNLATAQAMSLLLHLLDDHLTDGQVPTTHLLLQLRSEAWSFYRSALAGPGPAAQAPIEQMLERYFTGIHDRDTVTDLDTYGARFKLQIGTWLAGPVAFAGEDVKLTNDVIAFLEHFSLAWRFLDDLQDVEEDAAANQKSTLYWLLDERGRELWSATSTGDGLSPLKEFILDRGYIDGLVERILNEMNLARRIAEGRSWKRLTDQLDMLTAPLRDIR